MAYSIKPASEWTKEDVADWARKECDFDPDELEELKKAKIKGKTLLAYQKVADLFYDFEEEIKQKQILKSALRTLWAEIEKLKKSLVVPGEPSELDNALRSLSVGESAQVRDLIRSSVRKKKMQTVIDLLQRSSDEKKAFYLADWFEEVACKNEVAMRLNFDNEEKENKFIREDEHEQEEEDFMKTIPLQDRASAMHKLALFCNFRFDKYKGKSKQNHAYLTISGPSGAGKTRLCFEALKLIKDQAETRSTPFISIYLDFSNGARYDPDIDSKLKGGPFLAARVAAQLLADLSYDRFIRYAKAKYSHDTIAQILNQLTLEVVIATYCHRKEKSRKIAVALVLDEINEVYAVELSDARLKGLIKQITIEIGAFMRPSPIFKNDQEIFPAQQTVLLPVICGTSMDGIDEAIKISGFTHYAPELTLLQEQSVLDCFSEYCTKNNQTALLTKLDKDMLTRILQYFGVIPRGLEYVISNLQQYLDNKPPSSLISKIHDELGGWWDFIKYQQSFNGIDQAKLYMQMCTIGISCLSQFTAPVQAIINQAKRAGLYYTLNNKLFFCPSILKIFNEGFHFFEEDLLPLPGIPFYWQHFKRLEAQLEVVKVNTWLSMGLKQVPLTTLFAGAKFGSGLKNTSIQLLEMHYHEESQEFPGSIKYTKEDQVISTETIYSLAIQCQEANPLLDICSAYRASNGKPVLIVKQLKHGKLIAESKTTKTGKKKTINFELISIWLSQTKKNLADQGYADAFKIFYVWITNKEVLEVPQLLPSALVLVEKTNVQEYFGPSISLLSNLAQIRDKKD